MNGIGLDWIKKPGRDISHWYKSEWNGLQKHLMLSDRRKRDYRLLYSISMKPCANAIIMYQLNVGSVNTQTEAHRDSENIYTHFGMCYY